MISAPSITASQIRAGAICSQELARHPAAYRNL